jgi:DNA-binding IclR family transcriptional regulator
MATAARAAEDEVLRAVSKNPGASVAELARQLGWMTSKGQPHKSKIHRCLEQLVNDKLLKNERRRRTVTERGREVLEGK